MVYGTPEAQDLVQQCGDTLGILQSSWETDVGDSIIDELMESWHELLSQVRKDLGVPELPPKAGDTVARHNSLVPKLTVRQQSPGKSN